MSRLEGKVVVITGGSSGSGVGIARRFLAEGADVALLARGSERLIEVAKSLGERAVPVVCDVGDPDSVRSAFDEIGSRFGRIDVLINNAAVYRPCGVEHLSDSDIQRQVATNFIGPVYTCRSAIPWLRAAGGGDIINTSSESTLHPFPLLSMYVSTKAALETFGEVLGQEVRDDDIRVTTLVQGTTADGGNSATDWEWDPQQRTSALALWTERGLLSQVYGKYGGQDVEAIGDVHIFIVTRPRTQRLDKVHCRSF